MKHILIVGATSAMADQCARLWATRGGARLVLVGRDERRLETIAQDLRVRGQGVEASTRVVDFEDAAAIGALVREAAAERPVDIALVAHGHLPDQPACEAELTLAARELSINGVSPVLFAEAIAGEMQRAGRGALAVIGSVAGDRGRKSNYVYGSAKGLVERYVEGLQHRLAATPVRVTLVKPGPTDTPMTAHLKRDGAKLADVAAVARDIVSATEAGKPVLYTPGKWVLIMAVIRNLPRAVFHRMNI
ncbi:SDR family NAD(P)-dependent oxidoreductase [Roseateles sp. BYS96W]|uniref:SDR family NAD(P)-dependent oxidoreductase n=1 Tax=Pelomonas nitida TaxID=3299027 RepID=A0ABW7G4R6_9BURK